MSSEFQDGWLAQRIHFAAEQITELGDDWQPDIEKCPECGEHLRLAKAGDHYEVLTRVITGKRMVKGLGMMPAFESRHTPCKYPHGLTPFDVTISAPTGKLAFFNFLAPAFDPVPQETMYKCDISATAGMVKYTEEYAKHNILYAYCGNTSVQAYRTPDGIDFRHSYEFDEKGDIFHPDPVGNSVCCDVWWFTVLDLGELKRLYNTDTPEVNFKDRDFVVLDVVPGSYIFTMDYGANLRYRALASGKLRS